MNNQRQLPPRALVATWLYLLTQEQISPRKRAKREALLVELFGSLESAECYAGLVRINNWKGFVARGN